MAVGDVWKFIAHTLRIESADNCLHYTCQRCRSEHKLYFPKIGDIRTFECGATVRFTNISCVFEAIELSEEEARKAMGTA